MLRQAAAVLVCILWAGLAQAQVWLQVESQPNAPRAIERAGAYANVLPDVNVFRTGTRWHAIALGPFATEAEARRRLAELRANRLIPRDSFVADGTGFRGRIFGTGTGVAAAAPAQPIAPAPVLEPGEETPEEARRSERDLTREDRALLQTALRYEGFYTSVIDASFGPGTRRAMSAWQEANGFEPTGILTTLQRREVIAAYQGVLDSLAMAPATDEKAGIEIDLPTALVAFDRYDAPFAHYEPVTEDGVKLVLISTEGDATTLAAFYDLLQTLEVVPAEGDRSLGRESFTIEGRDDDIQSYTFVRRASDAIKGFTLIWPMGDEKRFRLALDQMRASLRTTEAILPSTASTGIQDIDLLSGLEIRRPDRARSGFYIDAGGAVLTTAEAVRQCRRITVDDDVEADIVAADNPMGLALLRPREPLAPLSIARLTIGEPRLASDVAVAGYSFGGLLSAPTLTYGTLADLKGLDGDTRLNRLSLSREDGDAGGPVFDTSGNVLGMLLDTDTGARQLPGDVAFAASAPALADFLTANGVTPAARDNGAAIAPEDLTVLAADLTVLVNCWN